MIAAPIATNARELLESLKSRDVHLRANGDRLQLDAPQGAFTDADRADVARLKPQILALLQSQPPAHRWSKTPPDLNQLAVIVEAARRGLWIRPTPELMRAWKALSSYAGCKLTSRHIGAATQLATDRRDLNADDLLELFVSGLLRDEGGAVWQMPDDARAATPT